MTQESSYRSAPAAAPGRNLATASLTFFPESQPATVGNPAR